MSTKREGNISGFLPMSYRGRAEAFARHLHCRLRSLGTELPAETNENTSTDAASWLSSTSKPLTTALPERNSAENDLFIDFALESPGSPGEEIAENDLHKIITNATDNLGQPCDGCQCAAKCGSRVCDAAGQPPALAEDTPETSDSSDYYDPELCETDLLNQPPSAAPPCGECVPQSTNGISTEELRTCDNKTDNGESDTKDNLNVSETTIYINNDETVKDDSGNYCCSINIKKEMTIDCNSPITLLDKENDNTEENCSPNSLDDDLEMEERTPRVRRCSSLKTGKTPPGTPGQKKIVRFADVLGLDLADVRTYLDEIPKIPTSAYEDLNDADLSLNSDLDNGLPTMSSLDSQLNPMYAGQKPDKVLVPLFQQPGGAPDFLDRVKTRQCCLENACVQDTITLSIAGTVRVRNLDFNKSVHIRYTLDSWKSFADLQATYVPNTCDGFSDKFSFLLYCHTLSVGQRIEFAVRFQVKGAQYWDNNLGTNYCFQCLPASTSTPYLPLTSTEEHWGSKFY